MKTWTQEEVEVLTANYNSVSNDQLCELIPAKTRYAIYKKAYKMGLRKTAEATFRNRSEAKKGEKGSNWKGGVMTNSAGYRLIQKPGHHRAYTNGYVMEHIAVWEQETGVSVPPNCCIHHLNGDKSDNRIENLCMMLRKAHTVFHHTGTKRSAETKQKISNARRHRNA